MNNRLLRNRFLGLLGLLIFNHKLAAEAIYLPWDEKAPLTTPDKPWPKFVIFIAPVFEQTHIPGGADKNVPSNLRLAIRFSTKGKLTGQESVRYINDLGQFFSYSPDGKWNQFTNLVQYGSRRVWRLIKTPKPKVKKGEVAIPAGEGYAYFEEIRKIFKKLAPNKNMAIVKFDTAGKCYTTLIEKLRGSEDVLRIEPLIRKHMQEVLQHSFPGEQLFKERPFVVGSSSVNSFEEGITQALSLPSRDRNTALQILQRAMYALDAPNNVKDNEHIAGMILYANALHEINSWPAANSVPPATPIAKRSLNPFRKKATIAPTESTDINSNASNIAGRRKLVPEML